VERSEVRRHSLRCRRAQRTNRVATTSLSYVRALTRVKSPGHQTSLTFVTLTQHVPRRRYSAYRDAAPATGHAGSGPRSPPSPHCPPGRC